MFVHVVSFTTSKLSIFENGRINATVPHIGFSKKNYEEWKPKFDETLMDLMKDNFRNSIKFKSRVKDKIKIKIVQRRKQIRPQLKVIEALDFSNYE